jgi:heat shock factor-binding protein 1
MDSPEQQQQQQEQQQHQAGPNMHSSQQSAAEANAYVQQLVQQVQRRFEDMSQGIVSRLDDMGGKLDELEKSVADILERAAQQEQAQQQEQAPAQEQ